MPVSGKAALQKKILSWYRRHKRALPWRGAKDPYRVWVSELMLQQTQVAAVIPYYRRFLRRFPTMKPLARAPLDAVLKQWEGLGYYRRARYLHEGAKYILREHGGRFPRSYEEAIRIPGVGSYTAGAVLSIAYGVPAPALDANAGRVLARLFAEKNPHRAAFRKRAAALVPEKNAGEWTQALMELGALVCRAKKPLCGKCPASGGCQAVVLGKPESYPAKARPAAPKPVRAAAAVLENGGRYLVRKRGGRFLGGLWEFPWWEISKGKSAAAVLRGKLRGEFGIPAKPGRCLMRFTQVYSHREIAMTVYAYKTAGRNKAKGRWLGLPEMRRLAMGAAQRKIVQALLESPTAAPKRQTMQAAPWRRG